MAKDFTDQRPVELEGLTGTVVRMGKELNVATPVNDFLYAILKPMATRIESLHNSGS
jgi:ketopantoate reductase